MLYEVITCDIIYHFRKEIAAQTRYRLINKETGEPLKIVDHIGCHYAKIFPEKGVITSYSIHYTKLYDI